MKRHRLDLFALSAGAFFAVLAAGFLLAGLGTWDVDVTWIAPVLLIAFGFAGLVSAVGRAARADLPTEPETGP